MILALAISMYDSSRSMPMNEKPSRRAAMPVEPLPVNGSRIRPCGGVMRRQSHCMRSTGLTVGWLFRYLRRSAGRSPAPSLLVSFAV